MIEFGGEEFNESKFTTQNLEIKLLKDFGEKIVIHEEKSKERQYYI